MSITTPTFVDEAEPQALQLDTFKRSGRRISDILAKVKACDDIIEKEQTKRRHLIQDLSDMI